MKAAFLCESSDKLMEVYGPRQRAALAERVELADGVAESVDDEALRDAEAIFSTWGMPACTEEQIHRYLPRVKAVYYAAGSVQGFARPFLRAGVRVFSAWQANAVPVAEFAHAQILLALKGYFQVQPLTASDRAAATRVYRSYPGAYEVQVGLLGCGAVGSRVARLLRQNDVETLAFDPFLSDERAAELGVRRATMEEIFAQCDVVSNHLANLPETVGIIRREHLMSMKPRSTLINTGRGAQLSERDLKDMLEADPTRTALIDVLTDENHAEESPLVGLPNCFLTPHIAGSSGNEVRRMADYMIRAFDCVQAGRTCGDEVTMKMLDAMA